MHLTQYFLDCNIEKVINRTNGKIFFLKSKIMLFEENFLNKECTYTNYKSQLSSSLYLCLYLTGCLYFD